MLSAMPMIGVASGAMIIAPMTVAVESVMTPAVAMTADRNSIAQKPELLETVSPVPRSRSSVSSSSDLRCCSGRSHEDSRVRRAGLEADAALMELSGVSTGRCPGHPSAPPPDGALLHREERAAVRERARADHPREVLTE